MRVKNTPLFLIASLIFGLKTYIVYRFIFNIEINNLLQEIILFINPFITSFIFFGISIWFRNKKRQVSFVKYATLIGTIIIYFNLIFYRSFTDFLTVSQLFQMSHLTDLGTSILSLIKFYDVFIFIDVIIIWSLNYYQFTTYFVSFNRKFKRVFILIALSLITINLILIEIERPQLFSRAFDREYLVKNIGVFYYHIYDVVMQTKIKAEKVFASENELIAIENYMTNKRNNVQLSNMFGIAKNRNIIFISAESIQSFVINNTLHNEEVTPFLNRLINDQDTYYFENFYHQTAQGKTSDSEFLTENSLYPTASGAVFFTHAENKYHSLAEMLKEENYTSVVFHANDGTFWNRNQMYEQLGVDKFYNKTYYDVNDENSVGWGLKDKHFFEQSMTYLRELEEPFYSKFITITNHFPFELEEEERTLEPFDSNSTTLNNYFSTVRYTDEAIEQFFTQLKLTGLYDNSIIIIMGDHDGISANHNRAMGQYLNKEEITPYDYIQLQRVPFFIHIPGHGEGKIMSKVAGQIDVKPTLLHLIGIHSNNDIYFGRNLFQSDDDRFIALRNGDFISDEYIFTAETCYDRKTGEVVWSNSDVEIDERSACLNIKEKVETELQFSDSIINGDLFRFVNFER